MPEIMSKPIDGESSSRKRARLPEKSSFSHTCNLLSQYLKGRGSFRDLSLGMTCNLDGKGKSETFRPTTTMDLLPKIEISGGGSERKESVKSMDLFPQHAGFGSSEDARKSCGDLRPKTEQETAQMTIFYAGKVHVFNDFPAEKVKEVMLLAGNGRSVQHPGNERGNFPLNNTNPLQDHLQQPPPADGSDMPLARKVSLHRFLEKRKERIISKAPYQLHREESAAHSKPPTTTESKSWLGLASSQPN